MIISKEKKQALDSFIHNVACISDKEYQKRVWVQAEGPECDDIDDAVCDFFDEDYILENHKDFGITETQKTALVVLHKKLKEFKEKFRLYSPEKSTEKLIQLPEWQEIREIAKCVVEAFGYKKL